MLIALLMLLAAASGAGGEQTPMTAPQGYFQSYSVPYDPKVPPVYPDGTRGDEFRQMSPPSSVDPSFVQLESKWQTFDPSGEDLGVAVVDPRRHMMLLTGGGAAKGWHGVWQPLPVPLVGETVAYHLIVRAIPAYASTEATNTFYTAFWGMLLAEDIEDDPGATPLWAAAMSIDRQAPIPPDPHVLSGRVSAMTFAAYDAAGNVEAEAQSAWPLTYVRARVRSEQPSADVFETDLRIDVSATGESWQQLYAYEGLENALRQFILGQRGVNLSDQGTLFDFERFFTAPLGNDLATTGETLELGST